MRRTNCRAKDIIHNTGGSLLSAAHKRAAPVTDAERQRRCRNRKRHECHDERPTNPDGSVRPDRTVPVTRVKIAADTGEKRAKMRETGSADVTRSVRPNNTLIHLTMGGAGNSVPPVTPLHYTASKPAQRSGAKNSRPLRCSQKANLGTGAQHLPLSLYPVPTTRLALVPVREVLGHGRGGAGPCC